MSQIHGDDEDDVSFNTGGMEGPRESPERESQKLPGQIFEDAPQPLRPPGE